MAGHDGKGRFTKGNTEGRGRHVSLLRRAMIEAVTTEDIAAVVGQIVEAAKGGDLKACEMLLDRCVGKVMTAADFELYTHEYDKPDFETINPYNGDTVDQIRPLMLSSK